MDKKIQPGAVVRLRSGGPVMTVEAVDRAQETAFCAWFTHAQGLKKDRFTTAALRTVGHAAVLTQEATAS